MLKNQNTLFLDKTTKKRMSGTDVIPIPAPDSIPAPETMLYIGAFLDMWPIIRYSMWVRHFIYVDGLPDSGYFEPEHHGYKFCKDLDTMIAAVSNCVPGGCLSVTKKATGVYDFQLNNGIVLTYIFNTLTDTLHKFADTLAPVTSMYICGYAPESFDFTLVQNLRTAFSTSSCLESGYVPGIIRVIEIDETTYPSKRQGFTKRYQTYTDSGDDLTVI